MNDNENRWSKEEVEEVAEQITLLFGMIGATLINKLDLLEHIAKVAGLNAEYAQSAFIITAALGGDPDEAELETDLRARRAQALFKLVKVLKETEEKREGFYDNRSKMAEERAALMRAMGL